MRSVPARAALLGALFAALVTLPALGTGTLWDNSETAYGEVAREILLTHDWVVMHLNAQPWFIQPPLYFWLAAAFAKVLGVSALALRLPSALATIAMGGAVGYATARIAGERAGMIASIVLSTSLMQAIVGRLAIMDALLDFTVAAAVLWWYRAFEPSGTARRRDTAFVCGALALAVGTLAKGPVAPVITVLVIAAWLLWERRAGRLAGPSARAVVLAFVAYLVVTLPWFIALTSRVGSGALVELIGHYTVGRYTGVIENQRGPFWYYLPVLILGFFPWIAFLPMAIANGIRRLHPAQSQDPALAKVSGRLAGKGALSGEITERLLPTLTQSFVLTASVIFLAFLMVFRSPTALLITMIPSLFAILSVFLVMRAASIPLNIATILIGSTILGATENDQVHFFYHFREVRAGSSTAASLRHALLVAGRPILFATLINASGFLALALSDLPPMRQFGVVSASAFVLALLADFTALPAALWILSRTSPSE